MPVPILYCRVHPRTNARTQASRQANKQTRQASRQANRHAAHVSSVQNAARSASAHATAFRVFSDGKGASEICSRADSQRARGEQKAYRQTTEDYYRTACVR